MRAVLGLLLIAAGGVLAYGAISGHNPLAAVTTASAGASTPGPGTGAPGTPGGVTEASIRQASLAAQAATPTTAVTRVSVGGGGGATP